MSPRRRPSTLYEIHWTADPRAARCWWWPWRAGWTPASGADGAVAALLADAAARAARHLRRRPLLGPAGPAPGRPHRGRGRRPSSTWPQHPAAPGPRPGRRRRRLPGRARSPTSTGASSSTPWSAWLWAGGPHGGRPGGLPGAGPPHPAGASWRPPRPAESADLVDPDRRGPGRARGAGRRPGAPWSWASGRPGCRRSACGPGSPTTSRPCPSPRPARHCSTAWPPWRGCRSTPPTLHAAADRSRRQVDDLIAGNAEHSAMVRKLEESIDASEGNALGVDELPSGEEIAAELERFLAAARTSEPTAASGPRALRVRRMKVDGGIRFAGRRHRRRGRRGRGVGLRRRVERRDGPRPVPARAGSRPAATERLELGTGIAVAFARNPMTLAVLANDLQTARQGTVHAGPGLPDQAAHHQALLDALVAPGPPHARVDPGHPGHLGGLGRPGTARLPGRVLHPHPHDPVLQPRPQPLRATHGSSWPPWAS